MSRFWHLLDGVDEVEEGGAGAWWIVRASVQQRVGCLERATDTRELELGDGAGVHGGVEHALVYEDCHQLGGPSRGDRYT